MKYIMSIGDARSNTEDIIHVILLQKTFQFRSITFSSSWNEKIIWLVNFVQVHSLSSMGLEVFHMGARYPSRI